MRCVSDLFLLGEKDCPRDGRKGGAGGKDWRSNQIKCEGACARVVAQDDAVEVLYHLARVKEPHLVGRDAVGRKVVRCLRRGASPGGQRLCRRALDERTRADAGAGAGARVPAGRRVRSSARQTDLFERLVINVDPSHRLAAKLQGGNA